MKTCACIYFWMHYGKHLVAGAHPSYFSLLLVAPFGGNSRVAGKHLQQGPRFLSRNEMTEHTASSAAGCTCRSIDSSGLEIFSGLVIPTQSALFPGSRTIVTILYLRCSIARTCCALSAVRACNRSRCKHNIPRMSSCVCVLAHST